jgi:hypothetical protein
MAAHMTPELAALLERAKSIPITAEMIAEQRRSWVRGELMLGNPEMTADEANAIIEAATTKLDSLRHPLPQRRTHTAFPFIIEHAPGIREGFTLGLGRYEDGTLAEVFIDPANTDKAPLMRDVAILISWGLQHGASIETARSSLTRTEDGKTPGSVIGHIIDAVAEEEKERP